MSSDIYTLPVAHCDQDWNEHQWGILWYCFQLWSAVQQVNVTAFNTVVNIYTVGLILTFGIQMHYMYITCRKIHD